MMITTAENRSMFRVARFAAGALALAALILPVSDANAQTAGAEDPFGEDVAVNYVIVPFVIFNQNGRPITNLQRRQFELLVDGQPVATDLFDRSTRNSVSFTILLDGSGSMALGNKLEGARRALTTLIRRGRPGDDYSLYVFSAGEVRREVEFTTDGNRILEAVDEVEPFGKTALFDAILQIPDETILGQNGVRAIVLLTDGLDNASNIDRPRLQRALEGLSVPVYPLGLRTLASIEAERKQNREATLDLAVLAGLAGASGGRMAITSGLDSLDDAIGDILNELRSQYVVGFRPSGKDGVRYRSFSLTLNRSIGSVRIRAGYRGTAPPIKN